MNLNKPLIQQAKALKGRAAEDAQKIIRDYETACFLSTGPIKTRSEVWEAKAKEREIKLQSLVTSKRF